jgi:hypothetical protein
VKIFFRIPFISEEIRLAMSLKSIRDERDGVHKSLNRVQDWLQIRIPTIAFKPRVTRPIPMSDPRLYLLLECLRLVVFHLHPPLLDEVLLRQDRLVQRVDVSICIAKKIIYVVE